MLTSILNSGADLKMMLLEMLLMVLAIIPPLTFHERRTGGFRSIRLHTSICSARYRCCLSASAGQSRCR